MNFKHRAILAMTLLLLSSQRRSLQFIHCFHSLNKEERKLNCHLLQSQESGMRNHLLPSQHFV